MHRKKLLSVVLSASLMMGFTVACFADTQEDLDNAQQQKQQQESDLQNYESRIAELQSKKDQSAAYLQSLNEQLTELTGQMDSLNIQYQDKSYELTRLETELDSAQQDEAEQHDGMAKRIQYMYENGTGAGALSTLFEADSFSDFLSPGLINAYAS